MTSVDDQPEAPAGGRGSLSRERVLATAVGLADREGLKGLTMRALAAELGVEAMSLYHHVANKEALLDGVVEVIVGEVVEAAADLDAPAPSEDWQAALRARILLARTVMLRHPWAPRVIETRSTMSPTVMGWFDGLLGVLREGGLSWDLIHHAMHALGSRALGFSQELFDPGDADLDEEQAAEMMAAMAAQLPNTVAMLAEVAHDEPGATLGWCDDQTEFEFGIDVLLDGIARRRAP